MEAEKDKRRAFVELLASENQAFYGTPDGRGMLRAFELTFEHRWIYIFELIQNALDAGAHSIALELRQDGDGLVFQHDGHESLDESDVEGLSKIFRSTKGATSVGFMGIGFKSVFGRFREARISGWGWTFRYQVEETVGQRYGDVQLDLLGAVAPIWDDTISAPESRFTTRFELLHRVDPNANLNRDLEHFLSDEDRTPLAILAAAGLQRLEVDGRVWELETHEEPDGSVEATALSAGENLLWQLFAVRFEPSPEAIARFLEHRRIQPAPEERDRVYAEAARPRQVLGVLPLDDHGVAVPPKRGRVYATLPTEVTLPFGLHVNADWLLNISRTGLREIEENPWQRDIVDRIADVVASLFDWVSRSGCEPAAARSALAAVAMPSSEEGGRLDELLAEERWLERLRGQLEGAQVLPVWGECAGEMAFVKSSEAIVPPPPLAEAFDQEPALLPSVLLGGPVVARDVLGRGASRLLERARLLEEIAPADLERSWAGGLDSWWGALPGSEPERRDLLFRVWGAVAQLAMEDAWAAAELPCVRTAGGAWLTVGSVAYFNEPLPGEREPGGPETRALIEAHLPDLGACLSDAWIAALRQAAGKESGWGPLSRAREWIEEHGRAIDLREAVKAAVDALAATPDPDWSVLVPFGHWVMHRRTRTDLLIYVLAESQAGPMAVPVEDALVADPYVERGEGRRRLLPELPVISSAYVEEDPKSADAHEWRALFEKAGAQGTLTVRPVEDSAGRYQRERVADFLGLDPGDIGESNDDGYTLMDFEIVPSLPEPTAPDSLRGSLAAWLEDGFSALRGQGHRKARYFYYSPANRTGKRLSSWAQGLSELAWVPCDDDQLRQPRDVLPQPDPAREGLPVSQLSTELLTSLEQEGVAFGGAIPEAPALRRLVATGSQLSAEDLADLLREIRGEALNDEDQRHLEQALEQLHVPSSDERRVPLHRLVRRIGGRLRGGLGGWILALGDVPEPLREELTHPDFPCEIPDTTTGGQAFGFIRDVWRRACSSPEGLANQVREVLPTAYAYCLEDRENDESLAGAWEEALADAAVFAEREWVRLADAERAVYFDDLADRRFFPSRTNLRTATGGHLGNNQIQQTRAAEALGLPLLSSVVEMEWHEIGARDAAEWTPRLELICSLLAAVRRRDDAEEGSEKKGASGTAPQMRGVERLDLRVSLEDGPAERVPVNARLADGVLIVAGKPVQFAADAAKELLRGFGFRQRGDLAADLTGMLGAIAEASDFILAADKFKRSFAPGFELPASFEIPPDEDVSPRTDSEPGEPDGAGPSSEEGGGEEGEAGDTSGQGGAGSGGSFDRDRALAQQKALAEKLKKALKGELELGDETDGDDSEDSGGDATEELGDELYREIAARYERLAGREPDLGDPRQEGWDLRSVDPSTGSERLIEVKGKGCPWTEDEVVELSRAQVRNAFAALAGDVTRTWYLYVVERTAEGAFEVLPIANPVQLAGKWMLRGESWRLIAEEPRQVSIDTPEPGSPED